MSEIFQELVKDTISKIERLESRSRSRSVKSQIVWRQRLWVQIAVFAKRVFLAPRAEINILSSDVSVGLFFQRGWYKLGEFYYLDGT